MDERTLIRETLRILTVSAQSEKRFSAVIDSMKARLLRSENNVYRLGVIGVTSSGKSTMINSLLGEPLLPSGARPSSSRLVSCHKGLDKKVNVIFENNTIKSFDKPKPELLSKYGDERFNHNNREKVKQIEILTPSFPLDASIVLVDSPGLDAYGYASHEELTMNSMLPTIDFCIFVTTCKTNSDEKMLSVLNTIASYGKPVIIVQNMIDSIKPSVDGSKTASMVAQEHKNRVEKIIAKSDIADKSKVCVVQISAIWALNARMGNDRLLLERSNYNLLLSQINKFFHNLKPTVTGQRMALLKKELRRISDETVKDADAKGKYPIQSVFEFQGVEEGMREDITNADDIVMQKLDGFRDFYKNRLPALDVEAGIKRLNSFSDECKNCFIAQVKNINKKIVALCTRLNIDSRDIFSRIEVEAIDMEPATRVEQKKQKRYITHHKWENSRWGIIRWFGKNFGDSWTEEEEIITGTKIVVDYDRSMTDARKQADRFMKAMIKSVSDWHTSLSSTLGKMSVEIDNRRREWEARMKYAEEAARFKDIGLKLRRLSDSIVIKSTVSSTVHQKTDYREKPLKKACVSSTALSIYKLSNCLKLNIHKSVIRLFCRTDRRSNIIIGWDQTSENMFSSLAFGHGLGRKNESRGITQIYGDVWLYHDARNPLKIKKSSNIFVLVNALQIGAAKKQIADLRLKDSLKTDDKLYLVIQDLQEVLNAGVLEETIENLFSLGFELGIKHEYEVLSNHTNPIYNLGIVAASECRGKTQSDEIAVIHALQNRFSYLFPTGRKERSDMENNIKIIINKTFTYGKINNYTSR